MTQNTFAIEKRTFSIVGLVAGLIIGVIAGALIGVALAYFSTYNPFIYIGVLGTIIGAFVITLVVNSVGERFGSTDLFSAFLVIVVAVFAMIFVYYSMWLKLQGVEPWATYPIQEWYKFGIAAPFTVTWQEIAPYFSYSVSRRSSSGADVGNTMTYVVWIIELVILVGLPLLLALGRKPSVVNPNTGARMKEIKQWYAELPQDKDALIKAIQAHDLLAIKPADVMAMSQFSETNENGSAYPLAQVTFFKDRSSKDVYALRYALGAAVIDDNDWDDKFDDEVLVKYMIISAEEYQSLNAQLRY